jgi:hypothetical protein
MDKNLTVSVRGLLMAVLVVAALAAAYILGGASGGGSPAQAADDQAADGGQARLLTMTGTGKASAVPDQLSFGLTIGVTRSDLDEALDAANGSMTRVLDALGEYGVAKSDVQTTGLSMHPVYVYHDDSPPTISGYHVSQRASVLVKDLQQGGGAVSAAVAAGGNDVRVGSLRLLVGDTDAVMKQARDAAVADATTKAEQYAEASGQSLGDVMTLREVSSNPPATPTPQSFRAAAPDAALSKVPIRAGRDKTSVTVLIVWELG